MSDKDISQMEVKELRKEVQELRDAFAVMQRKYEDLFYNLDSENFSSHFIKKQDDMKAEIKLAADSVSSKVSSSEVESMIEQTANSINTRVESLDGQYAILALRVDVVESEVGNSSGDYSSIKQTISGIVTKVVRNDMESIFEQGADGFIFHGDRVIIASDYDDANDTYVDFPFGDSFVKMDGSNFCLYVRSSDDDETKTYKKKIGLGFYSDKYIYENEYKGYDYPYITLGAGNDEAGNGVGCVYKLENGLWIGDASICNMGGKYPGNPDKATSPVDISGYYGAGDGLFYDGYPNATDIFIDLVNGKIYKYEEGVPTQI